MAIAERLGLCGLGVLLVALLACGGGNDDVLVAGGAPAEPPPAPAAIPASDTGNDMADTVPMQDNTGLLRETFSYRAAGRDPFESLITSGSVRPMPRDLRVTGITYDPRYPQRSVATLRDTTDGKRYSLRVGDQVGRLRVAEIRPEAVVVVLEELGVQRQIVLALRRRQEAIP